MTAPVGVDRQSFGRKRIFYHFSGGFTIASVLCGSRRTSTRWCLFRLLQGVFGAGIGAAVPRQ